jgi:hypothetical protein
MWFPERLDMAGFQILIDISSRAITAGRPLAQFDGYFLAL